MANIIFMSRGINRQTQEMIQSLGNITYPFIRKNQLGNNYQDFVEGMLQPIQLWSYVVPNEHLGNVLKNVNFTNLNEDYDGKYSNVQKLIWALRKSMHLNKIDTFEYKKNPLIDEQLKLARMKFPNVEMTAIGYKLDDIDDKGNQKL